MPVLCFFPVQPVPVGLGFRNDFLQQFFFSTFPFSENLSVAMIQSVMQKIRLKFKEPE
jgi:hypothetical protein